MAIRRSSIEDTLQRFGAEESAVDALRSAAAKAEVPLLKAADRVDELDQHALARTLSELSGLPVVEEIDVDIIVPEIIRPLPLAIAREYRILPLYVTGGQLVVGVADPSVTSALDDLRVLLGHPIRPVIVPREVLTKATNQAYDKASKSASAVLEDVDDGSDEGDDLSLDDDLIGDDPSQAPIIRFVNALLTQAVKERASDIHIEPFEKDLVVRFRVDGVLSEAVRPPYRLRDSIVARIKIMAQLNIAEKRLPQDGRIKKRMGGREIDLRVSTLPVRHGERVVMRILEKGEVFSLDAIGMPPKTLGILRKLIRRPHGILLVTGPTGSGKTTTLYSSLAEINEPDKNILTIEDPIEYELRGIGQTQVNHKINLTFASALRSHLRQDPDVIMVGEIRDKETAENAIQASLTGHLVFSTLHTNDAAGAFTRLIDMDVQPFLVASSIIGVMAQRLVRRLCPHCKEAYVPSDAELQDLDLTRRDVPGHVYRAVGCENCNGLGYRGRTGIYEFLPVFDEVKQLVMKNVDSGTIRRQAQELGMRTLREAGVLKVLEGQSTFDEVLRVTQDEAVEA